MATRDRSLEIDNSRYGAIFFLKSLKVDEFNLDRAIEGLKDAKKVATNTNDVRKAATSSANDVTDAMTERLKTSFGADLLDEAARTLKAKLPDVLEGILAEALKFKSDVWSVAKGIYRAADARWTHAALEKAGAGVAMQSGHPDLIATSIADSVNRGVRKGLRDAVIAGAKVALTATTAGIGEIINKIADVIETVVKYVVRFCEARKMRQVIAEAGEWWKRKDQGIDDREFTDWFQSVVKRVPVAAALVMNCGIAGDSMRFLRMTTPQGGIVSEAEFSQGVVYLDKLKSSASDLINDYDVNITTDDKMVGSLLSHAGEIGLVKKEANSGLRAWLHKTLVNNHKLGFVADKIGVKHSTPLASVSSTPTATRGRSNAVTSR